MTSLELAREIPDLFFIEAGFSERQLDGFQKEALKRNGNLYIEILRRIHQAGKVDINRYTFQFFAGLLMTWAEEFADEEAVTSYSNFLPILNKGGIKLYQTINSVTGTIHRDDANSPQEPLLAQWSFTAAQMAHANLRKPYERFLDLCVKGITDFPIITWGSPSPFFKSPQAIPQS